MVKRTLAEAQADEAPLPHETPAPSPLLEVAVRPADIANCRAWVINRIAQAIREADCHPVPGAVAGFLSDLRALEFIKPTRE